MVILSFIQKVLFLRGEKRPARVLTGPLAKFYIKGAVFEEKKRPARVPTGPLAKFYIKGAVFEEKNAPRGCLLAHWPSFI